MELLRGKFIQLKNDMTPIVLCIADQSSYLCEYGLEGSDPTILEYTRLAFKKNMHPYKTILFWFKPVREELELNLMVPINFKEKRDYLSEIIDFYTEVEGRIIEDGSGKLSTDVAVIEGTTFDSLQGNERYDYATFLFDLKNTLRLELAYLSNKAHELDEEQASKGSNTSINTEKSQSNQGSLRWSKSDTDLLELIMSLYELGAIQNEDKNLTKEEAIQAFSNFFGKEIKDHYKKLNAARNRKKDDPDFLLKLQNALQVYYSNLDKKN